MQQAETADSIRIEPSSSGNSGDLSALPSRRAMFGAIVAVGAVAAAPALLAAHAEDPAVALYRRCVAHDAVCPLDEFGPEAEDAWSAVSTALGEEMKGIVATTPRGLAVKLRFVQDNSGMADDALVDQVIAALEKMA